MKARQLFLIHCELARQVREILNRCEIAVRLEQSGRTTKKSDLKFPDFCHSTLSSRARRNSSGMEHKTEFQLLLVLLPQILEYLCVLYTYISLLWLTQHLSIVLLHSGNCWSCTNSTICKGQAQVIQSDCNYAGARIWTQTLEGHIHKAKTALPTFVNQNTMSSLG